MDTNIVGILYIVGLFVLLWFLLIRPQQKRQKQHQEMVKNLRVNDKVITIGGIYGTILKIKEESFILRVSENVKIEVMKSAISQVRSRGGNGDNDKD